MCVYECVFWWGQRRNSLTKTWFFHSQRENCWYTLLLADKTHRLSFSNVFFMITNCIFIENQDTKFSFKQLFRSNRINFFKFMWINKWNIEWKLFGLANCFFFSPFLCNVSCVFEHFRTGPGLFLTYRSIDCVKGIWNFSSNFRFVSKNKNKSENTEFFFCSQQCAELMSRNGRLLRAIVVV